MSKPINRVSVDSKRTLVIDYVISNEMETRKKRDKKKRKGKEKQARTQYRDRQRNYTTRRSLFLLRNARVTYAFRFPSRLLLRNSETIFLPRQLCHVRVSRAIVQRRISRWRESKRKKHGCALVTVRADVCKAQVRGGFRGATCNGNESGIAERVSRFLSLSLSPVPFARLELSLSPSFCTFRFAFVPRSTPISQVQSHGARIVWLCILSRKPTMKVTFPASNDTWRGWTLSVCQVFDRCANA